MRNKMIIVKNADAKKLESIRENAIRYFQSCIDGLEYDHYNVNTLMVSQILENPITHNCSFVIMGECSNDERITAFFDRRQKEWMEKNKDSCDIQLVEYNIKAA
ncbi:hypothetical protein [Roseburia inulinivorans]|jgi:hypothetical protein|uniref:Uncharacterized protein n=1 Tax=Roseburia inulinivorans TaxID=360807 RepID=A0A413TY48_9FIRM|nr:hypothetical protein [Roseburia inulinivorans]RHA89920.1 hypothetical protein DW914_06790 [Roseburia inulinivorans]